MYVHFALAAILLSTTPKAKEAAECLTRSQVLFTRCMELSEGVPAAQLKCTNESEVRERHCEKKAEAEAEAKAEVESEANSESKPEDDKNASIE